MKCKRVWNLWSTRCGNALAVLAIVSIGAMVCSSTSWADETPSERNCTWGGVKFCFTNICECCPDKNIGKAGGERGCRLIRVTPEILPVSGYFVSQDCLISAGPWSADNIRDCQGHLSWIELRSAEDVYQNQYSFLQCEGGEPYLVLTGGEKQLTDRTNWGSVKTMFR